MTRKCNLLSIFPFVCSFLTLTNCSTVSKEQSYRISEHVPFVESADRYLAKARNGDSEEQKELKIKAAGRLIYDRQIQDGVKVLKQLSVNNSSLADKKHLLMAKANLMVNNPHRASFYLSRIQKKSQLSPFYQTLYRKLLIDGYEQRGRGLEAVQERIKLGNYLSNAEEKIANDKHIWNDLIHMPREELQTLSIEVGDPILQGWVTLAAISQQPYFMRGLNKWKIDFPHHEANRLLNPLPNTSFSQSARNVALLLPMTGSLSRPGHAIRDGFVDAKSQQQRPVAFRVYNVAKGSVLEQYEQAIQDGADMVIGPLSKEQVDVIASQYHPVPTLLLNYSTSTVSSNAWEFGLSPIQEASQLADKLAAQGFHHAIVISPKGDWGNQVAKAFNQKWLRYGNQITSQLSVSKKIKYNEAIRQLLRIENSASREKSLKRLIGKRVKSNLRRRQDFDVVVLLTHSSKARQIVPLLKYYYLGQIPVYGISSIHAADLGVTDNRDLDGVVFPDLSYIYQQEKLQLRHWPEKLNSYNRLFAIGRDSFYISQNLEKILQFPAVKLNNSDDTVYLSSSRQLTYQLNWGKFIDGKAQRIS